TADALGPQDGLYTVAIRSGSGEQLRVIGSGRLLLVAPQNPVALLDAMTDPAMRIVSLTVTEKGYCHDPATGDLQPDHPDIAADLAAPERARSAPGLRRSLAPSPCERRGALYGPVLRQSSREWPHDWPRAGPVRPLARSRP